MMSRGVRLMIMSTLAFSLMQVCVKYLKHIPFHELILFRSAISLVLSLAYIRKAGLHPLGNNRPLLIQRGIYGTIGLSLLFLSIQHLPLASAATLSYLSPIFTAILGILVLGERVRPLQWPLFAITFIGVLLIKGFDDSVAPVYVLAGVCGAFFAGLAYNMVRKLKDSDHPVVVVFYFPLVALPVMAVWSAFHWVTPSLWDWPVLIAMGVLTQIGQVLMSKAFQRERIARVSVVKFLGIINAMLFSVFLFGENYSLVNVGGFMLVSLGVILNIYITKHRDEKDGKA